MLVITALAQDHFIVDTTFKTTFPTWYVSSVLLVEDGKILISGQMNYPGAWSTLQQCGLARLNADGSWDDDFPYSSGAGALRWWQDRFYLATNSTVRRMLSEGGVDPTFEMTLQPYFDPFELGDYHLFEDGSVVMSGRHILTDTVRGYIGWYNFIWFTNTGSLDTTKVHRKGDGGVHAFKRLADGKFIASGWGTQFDGLPMSRIMRLHEDGSLDTTFSTGINWGSARSFHELGDGRVYACGIFGFQPLNDTLRLARFLQNGDLDPSFNIPDFATGLPDPGGYACLTTSIYPWTDGRLIVMGTFQFVNGLPRRGICMIDSTGALLETFHDQGVTPYVYQDDDYGYIEGMAHYADNKYLVWGGYHGYDDETGFHEDQRFVTRLIHSDLPIGITETRSSKFRIFPNPTDGMVAVHYDLPGIHPGILKIIDVTGGVHRHEFLLAGSHEHVIRTDDLPSGIYLLEISQEQRILYSYKLFRQ
jgi:uncharacterized delta-60 repeat protein